MLYVQLDTNWPDHPKIIEAGMDGRGLHATVLCIAKRLERDGWVPLAILLREGASIDLVERLVELRLLERDGNQFRPWGWLSRNPSQAAIDARRASKAEAGRRGNHTRHNHRGEFEDCGICNPKPQIVAGSDRIGSHLVAVDDGCDRSPTKQKSEPSLGSGTAPSSQSESLAARALSHASDPYFTESAREDYDRFMETQG